MAPLSNISKQVDDGIAGGENSGYTTSPNTDINGSSSNTSDFQTKNIYLIDIAIQSNREILNDNNDILSNDSMSNCQYEQQESEGKPQIMFEGLNTTTILLFLK